MLLPKASLRVAYIKAGLELLVLPSSLVLGLQVCDIKKKKNSTWGAKQLWSTERVPAQTGLHRKAPPIYVHTHLFIYAYVYTHAHTHSSLVIA